MAQFDRMTTDIAPAMHEERVLERSNGVVINRDDVGYQAIAPLGFRFGPDLHALVSQTRRDAEQDARTPIEPCDASCACGWPLGFDENWNRISA